MTLGLVGLGLEGVLVLVGRGGVIVLVVDLVVVFVGLVGR